MEICEECNREKSYLLPTKPENCKTKRMVCKECLVGNIETSTSSGAECMVTVRQLTRWVDGEAVHNSAFNECTPDFSCCNSNFELWPQEKRANFIDAFYLDNEDQIIDMLADHFDDLFIERTNHPEIDDANGTAFGFRRIK